MRLKNGTSQLVVDLKHGASIKELKLADVPILRSEDGGEYQAALLFPFPNRLKNGTFEFEGKTHHFEHNDFGRPNALHGMIHNKGFVVESHEENEVTLRFDYSGEDTAYPFPFKIELMYALQEKSLEVALKITNSGPENMPCGFGWHPYFYTENFEETRLKTPLLMEVDIDEQMIPTGRKGPFNAFDDFQNISNFDLDTCFKIQEPSERASTFLKLINGNTIEVWQDQNFEFIQVFTPNEKASVALEPMTCNIDALNNKEGLRILAPNEEWQLSFGVKLNCL